MGRLTLRATGPVAPGIVWERYAVPGLWRTWAPHITAVDYPYPRLRPASTGRVHGPAGTRLAFTVGAVDEPGRTWSWTVRLGPTSVALRHRVTPEAAGSRTELDMSGPWALIVGYAPLAEWALRRLVTRSSVAPGGLPG